MDLTIVSVEDHEGLIPIGGSLNDAATYLAVIFVWAYERGFVSDLVLNNYVNESLIRKLNDGLMAVDDFVYDCLDGKLNSDLFTLETREFFTDYIQTGTFQNQLCKFFFIKSIYELPKSWTELVKFFDKLDKFYNLIKDNY